MLTVATIIVVGLTIFLPHYYSALFMRTKIWDLLWRFIINLAVWTDKTFLVHVYTCTFKRSGLGRTNMPPPQVEHIPAG